jgi:hypothetical protein
VLFVPHIADSLEEKQQEDICLPISPIYSGAAGRVIAPNKSTETKRPKGLDTRMLP